MKHRAVLPRRANQRVPAADLACAEDNGFQEVYTNDRHILQAARHFHLTGANVLGADG